MFATFTNSILIAQTVLGESGFNCMPIVVDIGIAAAVFLVLLYVGQGDTKAKERLERFGRLGRGADVERARGGGSGERLQDLLEKAAPALASPLTPKTEEETSKLKVWLMNGGWRSEGAVPTYLGIRIGFLIFGLILATPVLVRMGNTQNGWLYAVMIAGISFYLPSLFVSFRVSKRQEQIFYGLPDALDLMVVCVEAGLGLDAAMRKVCEEMGRSFPIISEEFSICNFQLQMGRPRRDVLHDLGVRTGVDDMKSLAAILIQADRFGSSIAQALRVQSDSMRVRRKQLAEERAAKTAVQLLFPLVLFIFPAIFIVLVGPAGIKIYEQFVKMGK